MPYLYAVVEDRRLAEDHVLGAYLVLRHGLFGVVEPYQVHDAGAVGEVGHDAQLARPHVELLETQDAPHDLYERHVARQLVDGVHPRAVYVLVGVVLQQVAKRLDAQLRA